MAYRPVIMCMFYNHVINAGLIVYKKCKTIAFQVSNRDLKYF